VTDKTHEELLETNAVYRKMHEEGKLNSAPEYEVVVGVNPKDLVGETKTPWQFVSKVAIAMVARVMELGAKKYGPYNWRQYPVKEGIYIAAAMRHLALADAGEHIDEESGQAHYAHVAACMLILLDAKVVGNLVEDVPANAEIVAMLKEIDNVSGT
jgi:hypothetical protein